MRSCEEIFDPHEHCIDITVDEVKSYLAKIQPDIKNGKFTVSRENEKTISFLESSEYISVTAKIKSILLYKDKQERKKYFSTFFSPFR